jgi:hypothetical protein
LVAAAADPLPDPPTPPAAEEFTLEEGQPLTIIGRKTVAATLPSATRYEHPGIVHRVFRTLDGQTSRFRLEAAPPQGLYLLADARGQFAGVLIRESPRLSRFRSPPGNVPGRFSMAISAPEFYARLFEPYHKHTSFALKETREDGTGTLQFVVFVSDPFEQIRNPRLRIHHSMGTADRSVLRDSDPRLIETDRPPLELQRRRPDEEVGEQMASFSRYGRHTTLIAEIKTPRASSARYHEYFTQLVYETDDGITQIGPVLQIRASERQ